MSVGPAPARRRALLALEFAALFFGLPLLFTFGLVPIPLLAGLWLLAGGCLTYLLRRRDFERRRLWNAESLAPRAGLALLPFVLGAPALMVLTWLFEPQRLFGFPRARPVVWVLVMLLYPVLSVYPQGLVYRVFLFQRYRELFTDRHAMIVASAVAFSFVHVILLNWVAPTLTLIGGLLFAWTYERTRSGLVASIQHAAFGCWIFTVGLGWYFYHGAIR